MSTSVSHLVEVLLAAAPGAKGGAMDSIVRFFKEGGPFMYVNIFWLACAIAVVVERIVTLMFRYNLNAAAVHGADHQAGAHRQRRPRGEALRRGAQRAAGQGHPRRAHPRQPRRDRGGQERGGGDPREHAARSQRASPGCGRSPTSRPWWASSAPSSASSAPSSRWATCRRTRSRRMLSNGISEAMNNTAFGLGDRRDLHHRPPLPHRVRQEDGRDGRAQRDEAREPPVAPPGRRDLGDGLRAGSERNRARAEGQRRMAFYFSQAQAQAPRGRGGAGELNIVPYLDILMNLIIFMLLSMTGLATFGILNVNAPNYGGADRAGRRQRRTSRSCC